MLEGIVEEDDVELLVVGRQLLDAPDPLLVDSYADVGELLLHLERLVTNLALGHLFRGQQVSVGLALIAPAEYSHMELVLQQSDEVFHMGRLASAPDSDVTDGDDGHLEILTFQDSHVETEIPESDA